MKYITECQFNCPSKLPTFPFLPKLTIPPLLMMSLLRRTIKILLIPLLVSNEPSAILPAIPFMICPARRLANGPDDTDSARADVYKTEVILAHGGQRMLSRFCSQLCWIDFLSDAAPPWFIPALQAALPPIIDAIACPGENRPYSGLLMMTCRDSWSDWSLPQTRNRLLYNGINENFEIVLFPDGSVPNAFPVRHSLLLIFKWPHSLLPSITCPLWLI